MKPAADAKGVLLRALAQIETIERDLDGKVWALCVCYSVTKVDDDGNVHENGGWCATEEPAWVTAAMLRRSADAVEESTRPADEAEE